MSTAPTHTVSLMGSKRVCLPRNCVVRTEKGYRMRPAPVQGPNQEKPFVSYGKFEFHTSISGETIPCQRRSDGGQTGIPKRSPPLFVDTWKIKLEAQKQRRTLGRCLLKINKNYVDNQLSPYTIVTISHFFFFFYSQLLTKVIPANLTLSMICLL